MSISSGFALLTVYLLIFVCYSKLREKREARDIEDGIQTKPMIVSGPVIQTSIDTNAKTVVINRGDLQTSQDVETETFTNKKPSAKSKKSEYTLISAVRRSHSVDEGTQTDQEETESLESPNNISAEEELELGYLVDTMKFYNNCLNNEFNLKGDTFSSEYQPHHSSWHNVIEPLLSTPEKCIERDNSINFVTQNFNKASISSTKSHTKNEHSDLNSPESIFNGNTLRADSTKRTQKLGVRGEGFLFISSHE